jgi:transcriptional regulator with XRE-family HTH domain
VTSDSMAETELRRKVGARVRAARESGGLTQEQVAQRVGMQRSSIANLEAGRQDMNISRLALVAVAVNLNLADLIQPGDLPELKPISAPAARGDRPPSLRGDLRDVRGSRHRLPPRPRGGAQVQA